MGIETKEAAEEQAFLKSYILSVKRMKISKKLL